jgi:hypothetical protein
LYKNKNFAMNLIDSELFNFNELNTKSEYQRFIQEEKIFNFFLKAKFAKKGKNKNIKA